jgi:hypothetical protein
MLNSIFNYLKKESKRIIPMLLIAGMILIPDHGSLVVIYSLGITIALAAASHILRKIMFPYINLRHYAERALETPMSAAVVFLSFSIILSVFVVAGVVLLS